MHRPRALILDEQTDALDPCQKEHLRALIRSLSAHTAVLLTTHILVEAEALWDRVLVIVGGRLVADEPIGASFGSSGSRCARRWSASGAALAH